MFLSSSSVAYAQEDMGSGGHGTPREDTLNRMTPNLGKR
jgi:hypothetical protein